MRFAHPTNHSYVEKMISLSILYTFMSSLLLLLIGLGIFTLAWNTQDEINRLAVKNWEIS